MSGTSSQDEIQSLVWSYLLTLDEDVAKTFQRLTKARAPGSHLPSLPDVYDHFKRTAPGAAGPSGLKRPARNTRPSDDVEVIDLTCWGDPYDEPGPSKRPNLRLEGCSTSAGGACFDSCLCCSPGAGAAPIKHPLTDGPAPAPQDVPLPLSPASLSPDAPRQLPHSPPEELLHEERQLIPIGINPCSWPPTSPPLLPTDSRATVPPKQPGPNQLKNIHVINVSHSVKLGNTVKVRSSIIQKVNQHRMNVPLPQSRRSRLTTNICQPKTPTNKTTNISPSQLQTKKMTNITVSPGRMNEVHLAKVDTIRRKNVTLPQSHMNPRTKVTLPQPRTSRATKVTLPQPHLKLHTDLLVKLVKRENQTLERIQPQKPLIPNASVGVEDSNVGRVPEGYGEASVGNRSVECVNRVIKGEVGSAEVALVRDEPAVEAGVVSEGIKKLAQGNRGKSSPAKELGAVPAEGPTLGDHYKEILQLDVQPLVTNTESFTCGVCLSECGAGEGVLLRECLHSYCRDCLAELVRHCDDEYVVCPYREDSYACGAALSEREVRALVSPADYDARLARTVRLAESRMRDAFHCRTADCRGWCVHDEQARMFDCPLCGHVNCLLCLAVHEEETCAEYAARVRREEQWAGAGAETRHAIEGMLQAGKAMSCPTCQIVVTKDIGCDWVKCSMCKTEICWARRMARWGPRGHGDISGGCRCRVGGKLCHPKCQNCH